jgi:hypothetical protein
VSLHTQPRDVIMVQRRRFTRDTAGAQVWVDDGEPIRVECNVYPLDSSEGGQDGDRVRQVRMLVKIHTGIPWPGDENAKLTHNGSTFVQDGGAVFFGKGMNTRHERLFMNRTGTARG